MFHTHTHTHTHIHACSHSLAELQPGARAQPALAGHMHMPATAGACRSQERTSKWRDGRQAGGCARPHLPGTCASPPKRRHILGPSTCGCTIARLVCSAACRPGRALCPPSESNIRAQVIRVMRHHLMFYAQPPSPSEDPHTGPDNAEAAGAARVEALRVEEVRARAGCVSCVHECRHMDWADKRGDAWVAGASHACNCECLVIQVCEHVMSACEYPLVHAHVCTFVRMCTCGLAHVPCGVLKALGGPSLTEPPLPPFPRSQQMAPA